jgi:hypothetical protein
VKREPDRKEPGRWRTAAELIGLVDSRPRRPMTVRRFLWYVAIPLPFVLGAIVACEVLDWP